MLALAACGAAAAQRPTDPALDAHHATISTPPPPDDEAMGAGAALALDERIETLPHHIAALIVEPAAPKAVAIMLPGGDGQLGLASGAIARGAKNFLIRTRHRFADAGLVVIVVDMPDARAKFRLSERHAEDLLAITEWAAVRWHLPVWLVGTSRGTISVANAAAHGAPVAGIVLTSTVTAGDLAKGTVRSVAVGSISVPTLFVHHRHDDCDASPLAGAEDIAKRFTAPVTWRLVDGGAEIGLLCGPESHHGYFGIEADVVAQIAAFVLRA